MNLGNTHVFALCIVGAACLLYGLGVHGPALADTSPLSLETEKPAGNPLHGGSRALTPCATSWDPDTHQLQCLHNHAGKHLRTSRGALVTLLPSGHAHIVEPCGGHLEEHPEAHAGTDTSSDSEDPYVLWYVMAAPGAAPGTPCPSPTPYSALPYPPGAPNPNTADPTGAQSMITRHWPAGTQVPYVINTPPGLAATTDLFAGPGGVPLLGAPYTPAMFTTDVVALMNTVNTLSSANTPTAVVTNYPSSPPTYTAPAGGVITGASPFVWETGCGGPTGNALNEFIFLQNAALGSGISGGVVSMLLNVNTGAISECDVIYSTLGGPVVWAGLPARTNSGLAHEIGHFWGLDHTNLHPGGIGAALQPGAGFAFPTAGASFGSFDDVPAMSSSFTQSVARNRVSPPANGLGPWLNDDIAGFSVLYPVTSTATPNKTPLINTTATIIGSVVAQLPNDMPSFGNNIYVVAQSPSLPLLATPVPGVPLVGTISGTYRSGPYSVTGALDTLTGAPTTGEFRLDGIPILVNGVLTPGGMSACSLHVEPLGSLGMMPSLFGEWLREPTLNLLNTPLAAPGVSIAYTGHHVPTGNLTVNSMLVTAGTIIRLTNPIDTTFSPWSAPSAGVFVQTDPVSRPLVGVTPRASAPAPGSVITISVCHNRMASGASSYGSSSPWPLQSLTCTWNGKTVRTSFGASTTIASPSGAMMNLSVYTVTMNASLALPGTMTVLALEAPDLANTGVPSVVGENQVIY